MRELAYNREAAVRYADTWALKRNPTYLDFSNIGGDCTNFCSQCLFAGTGVMNYAPYVGWYYLDGNRKAPAWTAVAYLQRFLLSNRSIGPYAQIVSRDALAPGDLIQLANTRGIYYHSLVVQKITDEDIYVAAHTIDSNMRPLSSYTYQTAIFLKILGFRQG